MVNVFGLVTFGHNMQASATVEVILDELDASRKELAEVKAKFEEVNDRKAAKATRAAKWVTLRDRKAGYCETQRRDYGAGGIVMALTSVSVQARASLKNAL